MDPISAVIIAAIMSGALTGAGKVGEQAIIDAYNGLKTIIKKKYGEDSNVVKAINDLENEPDFKPHQEVLVGRITKIEAANDPEVQEKVQALAKALGKSPEGKQAMGKFNIDASHANIGAIGDGITIGHQTFGTSK
jgi:hypothetical protein